MITDFTLAACAEMIFIELPFTERVRRIVQAWMVGVCPSSHSK